MTSPPVLFKPWTAAAWMIGSIAAFCAMAVATRKITGAHDTFEILAFRSAMGLVLVSLYGWMTGRLSQIRTDRIPSHILRNGVHFTGQALWFWAITLIPLAQVFALEFTSPIWVILLAPLALGERLTMRKAIAALIGFAGILIVARPDFGKLEPGVLAAAGCAFFFAATTLMTKALTRREPLISILFWLTLIQLCLGLLAVGYDGVVHLPNAATLPWLVVIGLAGLAAHLCLTSALALAPATFVVPIDFARLPVIAIIAALFFGETLDTPVFVGAAMILIGNLISARSAQTLTNRKHRDNSIA
jgi:drug/metabolite transporter (DMT)-like permease